MKYSALIIVAFLAAACGSKQQPEAMAGTGFSPEFLRQVETCEVTLRPIEQQLKLTGKVEYDPDRMVHYTPLVSGVVIATYFHIGDKVSKGQSMALIRSGELSGMYAERQGLEAEIHILTRELESTHSMFQDNLASQKDLIEAQSRLRQAEAELEKANSNLVVYGLPGADGAFTLKAPISGFVIDRRMAPGAPVSADSEPLFTIADISTVWITANVYAGNLAFIRPGMPVDIRTLAYPEEVVQGRIDVIPQVFDPEEHVLKARIILPNADLRFKPEMAVDLTLKDSREVEMPGIPSDALIFDENRYFVVKRVGEEFAIVEVSLAVQTNGISYVEAGLQAGDRVVVKDQLLIYSKLKD